MDELSQENYPKTPTNVKLSTQIKDMGKTMAAMKNQPNKLKTIIMQPPGK